MWAYGTTAGKSCRCVRKKRFRPQGKSTPKQISQPRLMNNDKANRKTVDCIINVCQKPFQTALTLYSGIDQFEKGTKNHRSVRQSIPFRHLQAGGSEYSGYRSRLVSGYLRAGFQVRPCTVSRQVPALRRAQRLERRKALCGKRGKGGGNAQKGIQYRCPGTR